MPVADQVAGDLFAKESPAYLDVVLANSRKLWRT
jgi:hypothetical protein